MSEEKIPIGRVVMIHGVRATKANMRKMTRLANAFKRAGFCVVVPKYGFVSALIVGLFKFIDTRIADTLSAFITKDDILLGHSNGGTIAYIISHKVQLKGVIMLNAALECDKLPNADFIHVYYNDGDNVVWLSELIPFHPWGAMGKKGYLGPFDHRVVNINQGNPPHDFLPKLDGHSDVFERPNLKPWATYMATMAAAYLHILKEQNHEDDTG